MSVKSIVRLSLLLIITSVEIGFAKTGVNKQDLEFGFYADREIFATSTFVFNSALTKRISEIGNRVVLASDKPQIKYTFRVINSPVINIYAASGGFIYINTGLLDILDTEDELAAVLGHEIAHVSKRHQIHFMHSAAQAEFIGTAAGIAAGAALGVAASSMGGSSDSGYYYPTPAQQIASQLADIGVQTGMALGQATAVCMIVGYGRAQELEADALSIQYTKRANYDYTALVSVFKKLISIRNRLESKQSTYMSSLINADPGLEERIKRVETLLSKPEKINSSKRGRKK